MFYYNDENVIVWAHKLSSNMVVSVWVIRITKQKKDLHTVLKALSNFNRQCFNRVIFFKQ